MVKHFNVIMAGLISGIVALFTSFLGLSGTIIGSVLSSFLYQLLSSYSAERYEEKGVVKPDISREIVYIFPLVVFLLIELLFLLTALHYNFAVLFNFLENAVSDNLFRLMGIGLIILGIYPLVVNINIKRFNAKIVLVLGVLLFLRGIMDISNLTTKIYYMFFSGFDSLFALIVIIALAFVIFNILRESQDVNSSVVSNKSDGKLGEFESSIENLKNKRFNMHSKRGVRKVDTSFHNSNGDSRNNNAHNGFNNYNLNQNENNVNDFNNYQNDLDAPVYEEEIIYVNNPDDPNNPIRKRILKRVKNNNYNYNYNYNSIHNENIDVYDDYDDTYIIDDNSNNNFNNDNSNYLDYSSRDIKYKK